MIVKIPLKITSKLSTNKIYEGVHWTIRARDKNNIRKIATPLFRGVKTFQKPVTIKMSFKSRLDVSNHSYLFKIIEDVLKECKVITDDTEKYVNKCIIAKQKEFNGVIVEVIDG